MKEEGTARTALSRNQRPKLQTPELFPQKPASRQGRRIQLPGVNLPLAGRIKPLEFGLHELHILLLGDHPVAVGFHDEQKLPDVLFAQSKPVLRPRDRGFLRGSGSKEAGRRN